MAKEGTMAEVESGGGGAIAGARGWNGLAALAGDLAASEERYRTLFETMPMGIVYYSADGTVIGANKAASELVGIELTAVTSWPVVPAGQAVHEDGSPFPPGEMPVPVALRTGEIVVGTIIGFRHARTGELRWIRVTVVPDVRDERGTPSRAYAILVDLTEQRRMEAALRERAALLERARADRAEADSARQRLAFLTRAGALVAAARDRNELLDQVTHLVVPSLADYCVVFMPTADGMLRASSFSHRIPARARLLAELAEHPVSPAGPLIVQRAYSSRTTQLCRDVSCEMAAWASAEPDAIGVIRLMHPRSAIAAPLAGPHGPLGVLVLTRGKRRARFTEADVQVIEELARRVATGLANAEVSAREHVIAETLQRSLLPTALPSVPGLELAVRYLPATEGADVGGDWYDAFPLDGGRIGLVTGDVAGHSITSASAMGQVRSLLRAYAIDDCDPGQVLRRANAAVAQLMPDVLASAVYAVLDPATGDLSYGNAGHPPPAVAAGSGHAGYLDDTAGIMLGACDSAGYATGRRRLQPGDRLLLYTDGLVERPGQDIAEGLRILAETLRCSQPGTAAQTCDVVHEALLSGTPRPDDVCLLIARLTG